MWTACSCGVPEVKWGSKENNCLSLLACETWLSNLIAYRFRAVIDYFLLTLLLILFVCLWKEKSWLTAVFLFIIFLVFSHQLFAVLKSLCQAGSAVSSIDWWISAQRQVGRQLLYDRSVGCQRDLIWLGVERSGSSTSGVGINLAVNRGCQPVLESGETGGTPPPTKRARVAVVMADNNGASSHGIRTIAAGRSSKDSSPDPLGLPGKSIKKSRISAEFRNGSDCSSVEQNGNSTVENGAAAAASTSKLHNRMELTSQSDREVVRIVGQHLHSLGLRWVICSIQYFSIFCMADSLLSADKQLRISVALKC